MITASEVVRGVMRRHGQRISRQAAYRRLQSGLTGDELFRAPSNNKPHLFAEVNGQRMTCAEIAEYVMDTRGYFLSTCTISKRILRGDTGEKLLRQSQGNHNPRPNPKQTHGEVVVKVSIPGWGVRT